MNIDGRGSFCNRLIMKTSKYRFQRDDHTKISLRSRGAFNELKPIC